MTRNGRGVVDVHLHAWAREPMRDWLFTPNGPATLDAECLEGALAHMDRAGVSQALVSGTNHIVAGWVKRAPDRFIPSYCPDLRMSDPKREVALFEQAIEEHGFRALGELIVQFLGVPIGDERFYPLYRICEQRQLPVLIHTGLDGPNYALGFAAYRAKLCDPLLLEDVAATFPDLRIIMAHMSWPFTEKATYMLYAHPNAYMDVSTVNWILGRAGFHRLLRQVVETVGADKILFGTDQMNRPERIPIAVSAVEEATYLSEEDKAKILGENARRLLGI